MSRITEHQPVTHTPLTINPSPQPTWRTRLTNWVFGTGPADKVLKRRAVDLVAKLHVKQHLQQNGVYVDIGSGTGHNSARMARVASGLGVRFVCVEPVSKPTKRVRRSIIKWNASPIQFVRAVGDRLPIRDGAAYGASLFFVLHHIPYDIQLRVLAEIRRVLRPGGRVFLWEDTPQNTREYAANETWDRRLNFEPKSEPHFYRSGDDWQAFLIDQRFIVVERAYYEDHSRWPNEGLIRHTGFVLRCDDETQP